MFERFTDRARQVLVLAQEEARRLEHGFIGTEHILVGLLAEGTGVGGHVLTDLGMTLDAAEAAVTETIGPTPGSAKKGAPPFTPRSKKVLELALREALQLGHNYIGTEHMLLGLIRTDGSRAARVLTDLGATFDRVRAQVLALLADRPVPPEESGIHRLPDEP